MVRPTDRRAGRRWVGHLLVRSRRLPSRIAEVRRLGLAIRLKGERKSSGIDVQEKPQGTSPN